MGLVLADRGARVPCWPAWSVAAILRAFDQEGLALEHEEKARTARELGGGNQAAGPPCRATRWTHRQARRPWWRGGIDSP